jgi:hypothetical protein
MKNRLIPLLLFLLSTGLLYSQETQENEKKVLIFGEVVDTAGRPVQGFTVSLLVEREVLDISTFKTTVKDRKVFSTPTDEQGKYYFTWKLDDYYNRFYLNYISEGKFDDVKFLAPPEPLIDASKYVGKEKNFEHKLVIQYHPAWTKLLKLIEVYGADSDKGKVLRYNGFFEKETEEEIAGEKHIFWWYYSRGKSFKFSGEKLIKEYKFQPLESLEKID